ncbi:MAG: glycosyltransferase family 2 protein [Bacteroidota bacterium]|nr:glycosyltransferase family 2 protein [Bacteroidota bacterium]
MIRSEPLVSIIIPVFNRFELVQETIDSVRRQSYSNWELLLVDDGSTDGTYGLLEKIAIEDTRIKLFKRNVEFKGASTCRNLGIDLSKGEFIIFLDSDDLLFDSCLEERVHFFLLYSHLDFMIYQGLVFVKTPGDSDIVWNIDKNKDDILRFLDMDAPWQTTAPIWKKSALLKIGYWDDKTSAWEDMDFHVRALVFGLKYKKINAFPDYYYRLSNQDKLSRNDKSLKQLYARITLGEKLHEYLVENNMNIDPYKNRLYHYYMWIILYFIKLKNYEGVTSAIKSLWNKKIINFHQYILLTISMKINYHFIIVNFKKEIWKWVKEVWCNTMYKYYFSQIPPIDSSVKRLSTEYFEKKRKVLKEI